MHVGNASWQRRNRTSSTCSDVIGIGGRRNREFLGDGIVHASVLMLKLGVIAVSAGLRIFARFELLAELVASCNAASTFQIFKYLRHEPIEYNED